MPPALTERVARLRDKLVSRPAFQRWVAALPFTRPIAQKNTRALFNVVAGFVYAQTLAAMVELDLFRRLADSPADTATLAGEYDLPIRSVEVLMRAANALGLVEPRRAGWGLSLKGAAILGQGGIAEMVGHHHHFYADLADPVALMRADQPTALARFWTYAQGTAQGAKTDAADAQGYTALMAASQAFVASAVLHNRIFRRAHHLADLGGGAAAFAIAALSRHPNLTATVCERDDVVPHARQAIEKAGLSARADALVMDFFTDPPPPGADLFTLVRICHDHDDDAVIALLTNLARHAPKTPLAIIEPMADQRAPSGLDVYFPWYFSAMGQGRYRTRAELEALLAIAGYRHVRRLHSRNPILVRGLTARVSQD